MTRFVCLIVVICGLSGCITSGGKHGINARWPGGSEAWQAVRTAAAEPGTWAPLAAAGLLTINNADGRLTDWAIDHQPLFGHDADSVSNDLQKATTALWLTTALVAPSDSFGDKLAGVGAGFAAVALEGAVSTGLKEVVGRERPNGRNDLSFPSGHAGRTQALATMTAYNVNSMDLSEPARLGLIGGSQLLAAGTAWARVEAGKHHVSDVLVGSAIGHFLAAFVREAFFTGDSSAIAFSYEALEGGGAVTLSLRR